jgi:hypothetical protein
MHPGENNVTLSERHYPMEQWESKVSEVGHLEEDVAAFVSISPVLKSGKYGPSFG